MQCRCDLSTQRKSANEEGVIFQLVTCSIRPFKLEENLQGCAYDKAFHGNCVDPER